MGINGVPILDISPCLETQATNGLPSFTLLSTLSYQGHPCPFHRSSLAFLDHRDGLPGVCSREKRMDMCISEYQMLHAMGLSVDVGNSAFRKFC